MSRPIPPAAPPVTIGRPGLLRRRAFGRFFGRRGAAEAGSGTDWISRLLGLAMLVALGIVIGRQYVAPDKRTITVFVAATLFALAWRVDLILGIGVLLLALPWPRGTSIGSTNVVLVVLIAIMWLLRVSLRRHAAPHRTTVDAPVLALLLAFTVSFYNVESPAVMSQALQNYGSLVACMVMFYLIVNIVRTPEQLERVHHLQAFSVAVVGLMGFYELVDPSASVIPGWIGFFHGPRDAAINVHNLRVGGPFTDFELFSEYNALNILLLILLVVRARTPALKFALGAVLGLCWLGMFSTVTRGGIVSLGIGILYLAWLQRRRLNAVSIGLGLAFLAGSFAITNFMVARYTQSGSLLARLLESESVQFRNGMPVARSNLWKAAFDRMMEHPIIGHGPVYTIQKEIGFYFWPHNGYLFIGNLVGLVGLGIFLWLVARLWMLSRPMGSDLQDPNYARAFLAIGQTQLLVFLIDQAKIDFMRNPIYVFQIWLMFAWIVAAHRVAQLPRAAAPAAAISRS